MSHRYLSPETRFWLKVNKSGPLCVGFGKCWIWIGCSRCGYGIFKINNHQKLTHRYSYQIHVGEIPTNLCVLHRCDERLCVNPVHLFLGTRADNSRDMVEKERQARGGQLPQAILTENQVREIRIRRSQNNDSTSLLSKEFNVSTCQIRRIITRTSWRHVK